MNGEQLSNAGGGVSGGQAESGTHLASVKGAGLSGRGAVLGVRCVGAQEEYVRSNREFNRPRSNCAGRQLNNNYFWRDQRSFHGQQRVGYKREHWREINILDVMCVTGQVTSHSIVISGTWEVGHNVESHG